MSTTAGSNDRSTFSKLKGTSSKQQFIPNQIWHAMRKSGTPLLGSVFDWNKMSFMTSSGSNNYNNNNDSASVAI